LKLFLFLVFIALFGVFAFGQTAVPTGVDDVYLAKDDGTGHAGTPTKEFLPTDIPIYCVVQLDSTTPATVKMNLVAASVPGVKAETKVVSASYTTKDGQNRVNFYGRPDGRWTPGKYRADIFVDGKLAKNLAFEIKVPGRAITAAQSFQPKKTKKPAPRKKPFMPVTAQYFDRR
jgi:hypothetical protein